MNENGAEAAVEQERLKAILESLLFAAGEPVSLTQLANALDNVPRDDIKRALAEMGTEYANANRGIVLEEIAGGYQFRTPREYAGYVRRLLAAKPPRLSRPLLETLAIVAYRQPTTRPEIEQLRGVDTGGVLDTLTERGLIKIAGRKDAPGRPMMYSTTPEFLELFGLKDINSLPDLEEFRAIEGMIDNAPERMAESAEEPARVGLFEENFPSLAEAASPDESPSAPPQSAEAETTAESSADGVAPQPEDIPDVEEQSDASAAPDAPEESSGSLDEPAPASTQSAPHDDGSDDPEESD
ncbi:MAG TPA: SMC-Scp complex subunit ScpB [Candidatus Binataceae bacterium]|nr:SMC-Scp complex subunit ScpB [Candidatus Binataceae bacterium]